jgi:diguanylate cyclase
VKASMRHMTVKRLRELGSATKFRGCELSRYAEDFMLVEARRGVMWMAALSLLLHLLATLLYIKLGLGHAYLYTCGAMIALALHVLVSARAASKLGELYTLGIALLVVTSAALVLLAHKAGSVSGPLLASIVLLFMVMPLVPWGLKHCAGAILLVYGVFTLSTYGVAERFPPENLWTLQFLMLASALTTIAIVSRNVYVRREDIKVRFRLERAHAKMHALSHRDPLTGAWNRRFLENNFRRLVDGYRSRNATISFAVLDIDNFKATNDHHGHHHGDNTLRRFAEVFRTRLGDDGHVIRLGGDEFALLYCGEDIDGLLREAFAELNADTGLTASEGGGRITASVGIAGIDAEGGTALELVYRRADQILYAEKRRRGRRTSDTGFQATLPPIFGEPA